MNNASREYTYGDFEKLADIKMKSYEGNDSDLLSSLDMVANIFGMLETGGMFSLPKEDWLAKKHQTDEGVKTAAEVGKAMQYMAHIAAEDQGRRFSKEHVESVYSQAHDLLGIKPDAIFHKNVLETAARELGLNSPARGHQVG